MSHLPNDDGVLIVAVIDDHEIIGHGVRLIFEQHEPDMNVIYAPNLRELTVVPDVAILDLRLADGSTPAENLAMLNANGVPVVVYTSGDSPDLVRQAIAGGALAVMRKTVSSKELVSSVRAAVGGGVTPSLDWAAAVDADEDFVSNKLSEMEAEVLAMYASGELAETVARKLGMAPASVNTYISRIRAKYRAAGRGAESRVDLFRRAAEDGLISYYESGI
ncbi:MAG: response regulator transcription factor [Scrofimicrobium sp.]